MRILSVVPYKVFPAVMGGQKGIALFYKYLSQLVSLNCLTVKENDPTETYVIYTQLSNAQTRYINPFLFFKINRLANQTNRTHILFEHPYYAWLIFLFSLLTSKKIIVHSHNIESERFKSIGKWWWKILWYYERCAYRKADCVWFKTNEDKQYAQLYFQLKPEHCFTIPYGIEANTLPEEKEILACRNQLQTIYGIGDEETILLFNGTLSYKPNLDALKSIVQEINPLLLNETLSYKILICGKGLPPEMNGLKDYLNKNIIYAGFVDDIDLYFKGCDIFINPLQDGGGIKTKLVEALGFGKKCVSSSNGAIGVDPACTEGRLLVVSDKDWQAYSRGIMMMTTRDILNNNSSFYTMYSWQQIAEKAVQSLS